MDRLLDVLPRPQRQVEEEQQIPPAARGGMLFLTGGYLAYSWQLGAVREHYGLPRKVPSQVSMDNFQKLISLFIFLGTINCGVCCGIDYGIRSIGLHCFENQLPVRNIELSRIQSDDIESSRRGLQKGASHLPARTSNQDLHELNSNKNAKRLSRESSVQNR